MTTPAAKDLRVKTDAAFANLTRQLQGMEPHLERANAPGEWTTRQVLCHLLFEPSRDPVDALRTFTEHPLPVLEVTPGLADTSGARATMTLRQFVDALDAQRRAVFAFVDGLSEQELQQRKARIPLFKQFMGIDEIPIATYVGALFDYHWNDHAGQLGKIRESAGLPAAG